MKIKSTLILLILFFQNSFSQTIRDLIFSDVILIKNDNVRIGGNDFLINIIFEITENPIVIYNEDNRIPNNFFFDKKSFLDKQNEIILITPDWKYNQEIIDKQKRTGYHIHGVRQSKIYQINRVSKKIDSLTIREDNPRKPITFNFKKIELKINKVKGFILDNAEFTRTKVPVIEATIEVKGTDKKTFSDQDGKFEIQANEGEILVIKVLFKKAVEILVTDKECYKVDFNSNLFEPLMGGRFGRKYKRQQRKIERSMDRKIKEGFYNSQGE